MNYGTKMPDFGSIWRTMQKNTDGTENARNLNDDAERDFWRGFMRGQSMLGADDYSRQVMSEVCSILGERRYGSILEIGPGWGNYTFDLAEHCDALTCVDISPDVLKYIRTEGKAQGLSISTVNRKWEDYDGEQSDVVFGFNCFYRMKDIESCLSKINAKGRLLRIIGMTSGPEQEFLIDFEEELGLPVRYNRLDYIVLLNILYQLGIDCNVRIVDLKKEYVFPSTDAAARKFAGRIMTPNYDIECLKKIMRRYLRKGEDGMLHYTHRFKGAVIYW
ncbi:class I SAM-dependent methyltransferase [Methanomassiliicoccaceae archaeon COG_1]|nr:class I SAM-dependent methyltransferase [Methanomassiliicoccaceae archaeon COG_1]